jgi:hypothetical protein
MSSGLESSSSPHTTSDYVSCSQIPDLSAVTPDEEDNSCHNENNKDAKKSGNKPIHKHVKKLGNNMINK